MLYGEKVYLRLFEKDDLKKRVEWINDEENNELLGFDFPVSLSKTENWFNNSLKDNSKINFAIVDKNTEKLVGMTGLLDINLKDKNTEFYITIGDKSYRGKHIANEVIDLVNEYAFIELGLEKIYLHTYSYNKIAIKLYEKNGFIKEGIFRKHKWKRGSLRDIVYYSILKSEWELRRK